MPHVPYQPRPVPGAPPIEMNRAPLTSAPVQPDLPSQEGDFLDDLPLPVTPKRQDKPEVTPGQPRRREKKRSGGQSALGSISMKRHTVSPQSVLRALEGGSG